MNFKEDFQAFDIIKVYQNMGPFLRRYFDTGNTEDVLISINLNRSINVVVIRDGDADIELFHPPGNFTNGILTVRIPAVKMQVNHGKLFG